MKKYCKYCGEFEVTSDENFCPKCGTPFVEGETMPDLTNNSLSLSGQPATLQQDNRIHKGDKVTIGGDNFNAQNVDNRTVTNTSNTTINNINNIVDESRKVVQCELSGKTVQIIDTVVCPKCKRRISKEYYVENTLMCRECYQKKMKEEQKVGIPPLMTGGSMTTSEGTTSSTRTNVVVEPIGGGTIPQSTGKKPLIYGGIVAGVVLIAGLFLWRGGEDESKSEPSSERVEVQQEVPQKVTDPAVTVQPSQGTTSKGTGKETEKAEKAVEAPKPVPSQLELGQKAYAAGEYTKASLFLEKALQEGKVGAAYYLGMMYKQGKGVSKNVRKSFSYMKQAAEGGVSDAFYELAEMYRLGRGTEPNRTQAKKWYEEAVTSNALNADKAEKALSKYR